MIKITYLVLIVYIIIKSLNIAITLLLKYKYKKITGNKKYIYLTFDDGPDKITTPLLLDLFREYKIKVTFFFIGKKIKIFPFIVKRAIEEGHEIGIHGFSHLNQIKNNFIKLLIDYYRDEYEFKKNIGSYKRIYYRPPFGKINILFYIFLIFNKKKLILWNYDTKDYEEGDETILLINIEKFIQRGAIILFHDGRLSNSIDSLNTYKAINSLFKNINVKSQSISSSKLNCNKKII